MFEKLTKDVVKHLNNNMFSRAFVGPKCYATYNFEKTGGYDSNQLKNGQLHERYALSVFIFGVVVGYKEVMYVFFVKPSYYVILNRDWMCTFYTSLKKTHVLDSKNPFSAQVNMFEALGPVLIHLLFLSL